jgi:hypothetical protein
MFGDLQAVLAKYSAQCEALQLPHTAQKLTAAAARRVHRQPHLRVVRSLQKGRWAAAEAREAAKVMLFSMALTPVPAADITGA